MLLTTIDFLLNQVINMEYHDILKLNYEPFVSHFINQASGKLNPSKTKTDVVVVLKVRKPTKEEEKKAAIAEVKLVSPVQQSEDQAKEEIKKEENPSNPVEITSVELFEKASIKRKKSKQGKNTPPKKSKVVHDVFSK